MPQPYNNNKFFISTLYVMKTEVKKKKIPICVVG